jgi:Propeptide_C25
MLRASVLVLAGVTLALALTVNGEMSFDRNRLAFNECDGMTAVSLERLTTTWETGAPALPIAVAQLVVPQNMRVVSVAATTVETETVVGTFDIYPVQQPRAISDPGPFDFAPPDPKYYVTTYPGEVAVAGHQGSMFGYNIASVFVAPVQYNGAGKSLVFHPRVRFRLELEPADLGYLRPGNRSPEARRRVEAQIAAIVLNPQDIAACAP